MTMTVLNIADLKVSYRVAGGGEAVAADGVSCTVCHQIAPAGLGEHESFDGGFKIERVSGGRV